MEDEVDLDGHLPGNVMLSSRLGLDPSRDLLPGDDESVAGSVGDVVRQDREVAAAEGLGPPDLALRVGAVLLEAVSDKPSEALLVMSNAVRRPVVENTSGGIYLVIRRDQEMRRNLVHG